MPQPSWLEWGMYFDERSRLSDWMISRDWPGWSIGPRANFVSVMTTHTAFALFARVGAARIAWDHPLMAEPVLGLPPAE